MQQKVQTHFSYHCTNREHFSLLNVFFIVIKYFRGRPKEGERKSPLKYQIYFLSDIFS